MLTHDGQENNNIKPPLTDYSCRLVTYSNSKSNTILSKLFSCGNSITLSLLGKHILYNLVTSPPDSLHGILIVAEAPECNNVMLNVKRSGVLCQYYGCDVSELNGNTVIRVGYRSKASISSVVVIWVSLCFYLFWGYVFGNKAIL